MSLTQLAERTLTHQSSVSVVIEAVRRMGAARLTPGLPFAEAGDATVRPSRAG